MTRSHKFNDRDHSGDPEAQAQDHVPKYFAKHGFADTDPRKVKKEGGGKGNWGRAGDELEDIGYTAAQPRRRSNSSTAAKSATAFKTKFETIEAEPVFEVTEHGPSEEDLAAYRATQDDVEIPEGARLEHQSTASSVATSEPSEGQSVDEERA